MLHREVADGFGLQIEDADDLVLVDQRDRKLGAGLRIHHVVTGILADIAYQHGATLGDRDIDQAAAERHAFVRSVTLAETNAILAFEDCVAFVDQPYREHVVIDQAAQQLPDPLKQRVKIEKEKDKAKPVADESKDMVPRPPVVLGKTGMLEMPK